MLLGDQCCVEKPLCKALSKPTLALVKANGILMVQWTESYVLMKFTIIFTILLEEIHHGIFSLCIR